MYAQCLSLCAAPEVQSTSVCSIVSDMFSLGLVVCAIFNHGRPLIQANHSGSTYMKQLEVVSKQTVPFLSAILLGLLPTVPLC
jgi:hypothetical protein